MTVDRLISEAAERLRAEIEIALGRQARDEPFAAAKAQGRIRDGAMTLARLLLAYHDREAEQVVALDRHSDDPIRAAVAAIWGERCEGDQEPGCPICDAWAALDRHEAPPR